MHDIVLKSTIDEIDYNRIEVLKNTCLVADGTSLKLELDYKLKSDNQKGINEFLYYRDNELIGYLGISQFGGGDLELNGMVHPAYRRQGVFQKLFDRAACECQNRGQKVLLLTDASSISGKSFTEKNYGKFDSSEYEMFLKETNNISRGNLVLKKATNLDAREVYDQNQIYFSDLHEGESSKSMIMPEEEAKRGVFIYLVFLKNEIVGKVHLSVENNIGAIYGLGVKPEHRRNGYGRDILLESIQLLKRKDAACIMLQVVSDNIKALDLYVACGFDTRYEMSYYIYTKK